MIHRDLAKDFPRGLPPNIYGGAPSASFRHESLTLLDAAQE